jgi:hypothetical protein
MRVGGKANQKETRGEGISHREWETDRVSSHLGFSQL